MKKILIIIVAVFALAGCGGKSTTESIVDAGVERIERAEQAVKNTQTLEQCQATASDALLSAKVDMLNAGESCKAEISNLESALIRWKGCFWLLVVGVGAAIYIFIIRRLGKSVV